MARPDPPDASDDEAGGAGGDDFPGDDLIEDGELVDGEAVGDPPARSRRIIEASRFSGPLPPPQTLGAYNDVVPGLAREIVDQWKAETAHRHKTIDGLGATDHEAMKLFHEGEKRGQRYALLAIAMLLAVVILSVILDRQVVGIASIVVGGAALVWALRRRSDLPDSPPVETVDLADGDKLELPPDESPSGR